MHADQAEGEDCRKTQHAGDDKGAQHGFLAGDEAAVRQHRVVKGIREHLQQGHEQEIKPRVQCKSALAEQLAGRMRRKHEDQDNDDAQNEDDGLDDVGEDRAAQPALEAVEEHGCGEYHGRCDIADRPGFAIVAADHGGVAPHFVEQTDQNGCRKGQCRTTPVFSNQERHQPGGTFAGAQPVDDDAGQRDREPVGGVGQATDDAVTGTEIGRIGDRLGEDPTDEDAHHQRPFRGRPALIVVTPEKTAIIGCPR